MNASNGLDLLENPHKNSPDAFDSHFQENTVDSCSDAELLLFIQPSSRMITMRPEPRIRVLSPSLLVKQVASAADAEDEVAAMECARLLSMRVPLVRRVVQRPDGNQYIILDKIQGRTLAEIWANVSLFKVVAMGWQLRSILQRLSTVHSQTTDGVRTGLVRSIWLQAMQGPKPHSSPAAFTQYLIGQSLVTRELSPRSLHAATRSTSVSLARAYRHTRRSRPTKHDFGHQSGLMGS